jgi:hypothetical protein
MCLWALKVECRDPSLGVFPGERLRVPQDVSASGSGGVGLCWFGAEKVPGFTVASVFRGLAVGREEEHVLILECGRGLGIKISGPRSRQM